MSTIYTLSLHDALPIFELGFREVLDTARALTKQLAAERDGAGSRVGSAAAPVALLAALIRSEEHTSELQSLAYLVCRLLLEKKTKSNSFLNHSLTNVLR